MTESVMVMIPLLITFLSVLQISTGVLDRTVSSNVVQGEVATEAMNSSNSSAASISSSTGGALSNSTGGAPSSSEVSVRQFELPGGGTFTIGTQSIHKPAVSPLLPGGDNYEATGLAITE
jgi:hypothetical protein